MEQIDYKEKYEPKFHEGDWVIGRATENEPRQIAEITEEGYKSTYSGWYGFSFEEDMHIWSIQDAKDGDVLYSIDSKQPFIYKERPQFSQAIGYCCINIFGEFAIWNTSKCVICTDKYIPATKEQRNTLFAKIKDAGYEWDANKKELKKIEQPKIGIWIARDKNGKLAIFKNRPVLCQDGEFVNQKQLDGNLGFVHKIPERLYPEVTFENSPRELVVKESV